MDLFLEATRRALRFPSSKGEITVEDLWQIPLTATGGKANLDDVAKALHIQTKQTTEAVSFVNPTTSNANTELTMKFEIVKRIIEVRVKERDEAALEAKRRQDKQRLLELIAKKEDQALEGLSVEDLRAMVDKL